MSSFLYRLWLWLKELCIVPSHSYHGKGHATCKKIRCRSLARSHEPFFDCFCRATSFLAGKQRWADLHNCLEALPKITVSVSTAHNLPSMISEACCLSQATRNLHCNPFMGPCFAVCHNSQATMLRSCSGALTGRGCTLVGCQPFNAQPITYTSSTPAWQICQHASASTHAMMQNGMRRTTGADASPCSIRLISLFCRPANAASTGSVGRDVVV